MKIIGGVLYRLNNGYKAFIDSAFTGTIYAPDGFTFQGEWFEDGRNISGSSIPEHRELSVKEPWENEVIVEGLIHGKCWCGNKTCPNPGRDATFNHKE